jgi:hypothetical protein
MRNLVTSACILAAVALAAPASAAVVFTSTFESVAGGPTGNGQFTFVQTADGWSATDLNHPIELQQRVAGDPAPTGGNVFVELDSSQNSSMSRTIGAGVYSLSFLYSPRPGVGANSNGIEILLNGNLLTPPGLVTAAGGSNTSWSTYTTNDFAAAAGSVLTFRAAGNSDSFGGYVDNISLSTAVPEPATWAMMIVGFGFTGAAMRRRKAVAIVTYA